MKVLVIDDEDDIRSIALLCLGRLGGFEVFEASDGTAGVALAREQRPDAILLDVAMPGLDGPATLAALRAQPETAGTLTIFLTAKVLTSEVDRLLSFGAQAVLSKPFDPLALPAEVRRLIEIHNGSSGQPRQP